MQLLLLKRSVNNHQPALRSDEHPHSTDLNPRPAGGGGLGLVGEGVDATEAAACTVVDPAAGNALVHGGVPVAGGSTVGAGALSPGVLGGLVDLVVACNITVLNSNDTQLGVSQLLKGPQGQVAAGRETAGSQDSSRTGGGGSVLGSHRVISASIKGCKAHNSWCQHARLQGGSTVPAALL